MSDRVQDENLKHVVQLSKRMLEAAETGDMGRDDAGCGIVFGALRDAAYKLRKLATAELTRHKVDAGESEEPVAPAGCPLNRNCRRLNLPRRNRWR